jgi:hypothetical protein
MAPLYRALVLLLPLPLAAVLVAPLDRRVLAGVAASSRLEPADRARLVAILEGLAGARAGGPGARGATGSWREAFLAGRRRGLALLRGRVGP